MTARGDVRPVGDFHARAKEEFCLIARWATLSATERCTLWRRLPLEDRRVVADAFGLSPRVRTDEPIEHRLAASR